MRLVIDLQGAQGSNHARGIGRYSRELAMAMAREPRGHEVVVALNGALPETASTLRDVFRNILPQQQIRSWNSPQGTSALANSPLRPFSETLRAQFLASLKPDLVHVSSLFEGLTDDVVSLLPPQLERLPVVATCYDLIPLIRHKDYYADASTSPAAHWYYRHVQELSLCEGLLAISESSRSEAIDHLSFPAGRVFNIQAGISDSFRPVHLRPDEHEALLRRYGLRKDFVLFLGAGDPRKNEDRLIAAYARLPQALQSQHQLLIIGKVDQARLRRTAEQAGIPAANFVIVPFVPEGDLNALYSSCGVFVFPSLHEGFGLPVAEAMACGAPTIASNTTSLPEVIGREDATFDPLDPNSIAACMRRVLEDQDFRAELVAHAPVQAGRFTWESSASRAWDALEAIHTQRQEKEKPRPVSVLRPRPRLAFVSPLPSQASGISDYSRELLPSLARHYDITLVSEVETDDIRLRASFPYLHPTEFLRTSSQFDRVLYQVGNSHFHRYQIEDLIPNCPGVVVLHDAFLSDFMSWISYERGDPERFRATLLRCHGYPALRFEAEEGRDATLKRFPCSLPVLEGSVGLIQHSEYAVGILRKHFGEAATRDIALIPHLRAVRPLPTRAQARAALGLEPDTFIACSFGGVAPHKNPGLLKQAWAEAAVSGELVFAGSIDPALRRTLESPKDRVRCTGRLTAEEYDLWLAAADIAVQLRTTSRGESSGAVADTMMAGLPTIVNLHGSATELPQDAVLAVPDEADAPAIAAAIRTLWQDAALRKSLAAASRSYVRGELSPEAVAARYHTAIEQAYASGHPLLTARQMGSQLQATAQRPQDLMAAIQSLAGSFSSPWRGAGHPQLLIDISELARRDSATGIQRVVREMCRRVLETPPAGWRGGAVRVQAGRLRQTFEVPLRALHHAPLALPEVAVDAGAGDILLCPDINPEMTAQEYAELCRLRLQGTRIVLVIYDLLPMLHPELFPAGIVAVKEWYVRMLNIADGVACISRAVADELVEWLGHEPLNRMTPLPIGFFHLGADFRPATSGDAMSAPAQNALDAAKKRPTVLMTGTVEPRKGHPQALAAFEALWNAGEDIGLTIVGKLGWQMEAFAERLRRSPQMEHRLHWLSNCSDSELQRIYRASSGLLIASSHEGFGLPIIEAAQAHRPILARDIPVFREVAGDHATYFTGESAEALAGAVKRWVTAGFMPSSEGIRPLSWDESYAQLLALVMEERWHTVWHPPEG